MIWRWIAARLIPYLPGPDPERERRFADLIRINYLEPALMDTIESTSEAVDDLRARVAQLERDMDLSKRLSALELRTTERATQ